MGKDKIRKFTELDTFNHVIQPTFEEVFRKDHKLKGNWSEEIFKNDNPIVLELGCGKGEYTVGLAKEYPNKNFIGIDIKGNRMWAGAKQALQENLENVYFLRTRIELIESFFAANEISEVWITFPDPQMQRPRKRLSSARFLNMYHTFLKQDGIVHLKTDSAELHVFTSTLCDLNELEVLEKFDNLYNSNYQDRILEIKTHYEQIYLKRGIPITYIKFKLSDKEIINPPFSEEE